MALKFEYSFSMDCLICSTQNNNDRNDLAKRINYSVELLKTENKIQSNFINFLQSIAHSTHPHTDGRNREFFSIYHLFWNKKCIFVFLWNKKKKKKWEKNRRESNYLRGIGDCLFLSFTLQSLMSALRWIVKHQGSWIGGSVSVETFTSPLTHVTPTANIEAEKK